MTVAPSGLLHVGICRPGALAGSRPRLPTYAPSGLESLYPSSCLIRTTDRRRSAIAPGTRRQPAREESPGRREHPLCRARPTGARTDQKGHLQDGNRLEGDPEEHEPFLWSLAFASRVPDHEGERFGVNAATRRRISPSL